LTEPIDIIEIDHTDDEALQSYIDFELAHEPLAEGRTLLSMRRRLSMIDALILEARIDGERLAVGVDEANDVTNGFWEGLGFALAQRYSVLRIDLSALRAKYPSAKFAVVSLHGRSPRRARPRSRIGTETAPSRVVSRREVQRDRDRQPRRQCCDARHQRAARVHALPHGPRARAHPPMRSSIVHGASGFCRHLSRD